jgi:hypothetical protein
MLAFGYRRAILPFHSRIRIMPNQEENTGLLPRRLIFADPERSVVRISPDGTRVAFRAPIDSVLNLWVAPIDRVDEARPVTAVTDRNLGPWIVWMRDNRHVVFFREAAGDENWRAWRVDLETGDVRPLTPGPGVTCYVQQSSRHFPGELLIAHNERDKRYFDIYRVNVATGESALLQLNEGVPGYFTDQQFRVRFAVRYTEDGDVEYLQRGADGEWALFSRIGAEDAVATRAIEFSADGRELYWLDSRGHDTAAVVAQDLENGAMRVLAEDPRADFTGLLLDHNRAPGGRSAFVRARRVAGPRSGLSERFRLSHAAIAGRSDHHQQFARPAALDRCVSA